MRRVLLTGVMLVAVWGTLAGAASEPDRSQRIVRVMTRNVYHGVNDEIFAVPTAISLPDLLVKVAAVYHGYQARNFPERAAALAAEIDANRPDLIALQEAVLVRTQFPADAGATPATTVAFDYVQLLLDAVAARGLSYEVVVQLPGLDVELPSALGFDVRHTDREVILARSDAKTSELKLSNAQAGTFSVNCSLPSALVGPTVIRRGWVSVDVKVRGQNFRFVSSHLDGDCLPFTSAIQQAQAAQVVTGPGATDLPLVFLGDLNSPADGSGVTYNKLIASGFSDAWTRGGVGAGWSCCQAADLLNSISTLSNRIDLVLFRGNFSVRNATMVGDDPSDRTPSGLWPSDHAGVVVELALPK